MNGRVLERAKALYTKDQICPVILSKEMLRQNPGFNFDDIQQLQLDLMLNATYNSIMLNPELSPNLIMEDNVYRGLSPRFPFLGTGTFKSQTDSMDNFYDDDPLTQKLQKSDKLKIIDNYEKNMEELSVEEQRLRNRATEIDNKRSDIIDKAEIYRRKADAICDQKRKLRASFELSMDNWISNMNDIVKEMAAKFDIDQVGDFISKYAEFKRALKNMSWSICSDIENKVRDKIKTPLPKLETAAVALKSFRMIGYNLTHDESFNMPLFENAEEILKSMAYGHVTDMAKQKKSAAQEKLEHHKDKKAKYLQLYKQTGDSAHKVKAEGHDDAVKRYSAYMQHFDIGDDELKEKVKRQGHKIGKGVAQERSKLPKSLKSRFVKEHISEEERKKLSSEGKRLQQKLINQRQEKKAKEEQEKTDNSQVAAIQHQKRGFAQKIGAQRTGASAPRTIAQPTKIRTPKPKSMVHPKGVQRALMGGAKVGTAGLKEGGQRPVAKAMSTDEYAVQHFDELTKGLAAELNSSG